MDTSTPAEVRKSALVIALGVIGLVLAVLALLGSVIPLLGALAITCNAPPVFLAPFSSRLSGVSLMALKVWHCCGSLRQEVLKSWKRCLQITLMSM